MKTFYKDLLKMPKKTRSRFKQQKKQKQRSAKRIKTSCCSRTAKSENVICPGKYLVNIDKVQFRKNGNKIDINRSEIRQTSRFNKT